MPEVRETLGLLSPTTDRNEKQDFLLPRPSPFLYEHVLLRASHYSFLLDTSTYWLSVCVYIYLDSPSETC